MIETTTDARAPVRIISFALLYKISTIPTADSHIAVA